GKATCPEDDIVSTTSKLTVQPKSFNYHSLVKFDPVLYKSIVDVTIGNNKFTNIKVSGPIHFQYEMDKLDVLKTMKINSIILSIDDVETFESNVLYLKDFAYAECMDTSPLGGKPCNQYRIPTGTLNCCLCCRQKGNPYIFLVNNSTPVVIQIDHNNQMLRFWGKLKTDVIVDDQKTAMTFDVNLKGHFENFAPKASAIESQRIAECQENANKDPIYLSAAASFDIYDTLPTTPVNYDWYEDYRQSTEIFWGHGSNLIIPPWSLSYGIHHFTLIVLDNVGVADTDTFSVDVRDTVPPKLSIPADIHMVTFPPYSPTKAYLGEAVASDACCVGNVYISNDAPANSLFPPGNLTHVTWRADDSRGNTTTKVQKVYLYWVGEPHDWYTNLRFLVDFKINFKETMANTYNEINLIQDFEPVAIDFHQTTEFLHKVRAIIEEIPEDPDLRVSKPELLERLDPIIHAIQEMDELIAQMRRMDRRDEIKAEVLARIIRIAELLQEFGFILEEYDTSRFDRYEF
ncbi:hypothetical protein JW935_15185, partial [candidate division KSB1 bacterium]|nr:hypothetical protein [candidate division KSB1 bacterium]